MNRFMTIIGLPMLTMINVQCADQTPPQEPMPELSLQEREAIEVFQQEGKQILDRLRDKILYDNDYKSCSTTEGLVNTETHRSWRSPDAFDASILKYAARRLGVNNKESVNSNLPPLLPAQPDCIEKIMQRFPPKKHRDSSTAEDTITMGMGGHEYPLAVSQPSFANQTVGEYEKSKLYPDKEPRQRLHIDTSFHIFETNRNDLDRYNNHILPSVPLRSSIVAGLVSGRKVKVSRLTKCELYEDGFVQCTTKIDPYDAAKILL